MPNETQIQIRLTYEQKAILKRRAIEERQSVAEIVRGLLFPKPLYTEAADDPSEAPSIVPPDVETWPPREPVDD